MKSNILRPLTDLKTIETRLDFVDLLLRNAQIYNQLSQILPSFPDLDRCLNALVTIPKQTNAKIAGIAIDSLIMLKTSIRLSFQIGSIIDSFLSKVDDSEACFTLMNILSSNFKHEDLKFTSDLIDAYISDTSTFTKNSYEMKQNECFALKSGINAKLDVSRITYLDSVEQIYTLAAEYAVLVILQKV